jgi:hypothetical protein
MIARLVLAVAAVALALAVAGPAAAAGRPLATAINDNGELTSPDAALAVQRMRAAGVTLVRTALDWSRIAPEQRPAAFDPTNPNDPAYDWSSFDAKVQLLKRYGLEAIAVVNYPPSWAGGGRVPSPKVNEIGYFMLAAARRYAGLTPAIPRVRYWQVWNEPNVNLFFSPQFRNGKPYAPTLYRSVVNAVAAAVHSVHADNLVIAGGLSPFTVKRGQTQTIGPLRFMREMLCMSKGPRPRPTCNQRSHFDIWSHHPYTSGGPTHHAFNPDDVSLGDLPEMRRLLTAAVGAAHVVSRSRVRFWVTEFSWDTSPPDRRALPLRLQARWVAQALYVMWRDGIDLVTWLALRDDPYPQMPVQAGLYFRGRSGLRSDRPKPTLTAFRFPFVALRERGAITLWGRTTTARPGTVIVEHRTKGGWRRVAALRANDYGIFSARVRAPTHGSMRARLVSPSATSLPFSLARVPDRFVRPFGCASCR